MAFDLALLDAPASSAPTRHLLNDSAIVEPIPANIADQRRRAIAAKATRNFAFFVQQAWREVEPGTRLVWGWHMQCIADDAQEMIEELARAKDDPDYVMRWHNYLANIPPRCSKTLILSVFLPAWIWLRYPSWSIRCISSNKTVATDSSKACRELIGSGWYQQTFSPDWQIIGNTDAVEKWANTKRGRRRSHAWNARVTGEGTDIIIADDPHDAVEAESEAKRMAVCKKWDRSIRNRTNNAKAHVKIGIMQRLHELDWTGHVLEREQWVHRIIPMEYEEKRHCKCRSCEGKLVPFRPSWRDPRRRDGQLMTPIRFDAKWVESEKTALGSFGWAGQHQQRPAPDDGGRFKFAWWRFHKPDGVAPDETFKRPYKCVQAEDVPAVALPARFDQVVISVDCAFKDGAKNDRVAMIVVGRDRARRFIIDRRVGRYDFGMTKQMIRDLHKTWPRATIVVEDAANGAAVVNDLQADIPGMIPIKPEGGKESRAAVLSPQVEAGNWFLPDGAPWLDDFLGELAVFPNGAHDDQVDAVSQTAVYFLGSPDAARARMLTRR